MKFSKYNSIENSYREKFISKIYEENHHEGLWCVKEKIHGANFQIFLQLVDGEFIIKTAKRSGFLSENEDFHGGREIANSLTSRLIKLFTVVKATDHITVCGELFGGIYPHPEVLKGSRKKVQSGVFYSPNIEFMAFDLKVDGRLITANKADDLFKQHSIPYIPTLSVGSLTECLDFDPVFRTTIPSILGYPELNENYAEGIVIKPFNKVPFLFNETRVILKKKNESFSEKNEISTKPKLKEELPNNVKLLIFESIRYCTLTRLDNVISKVGEVSKKDFGKILKDLNQDTLEDFIKDNIKDYSLLEKRHKHLISKNISKFNVVNVKQYFMKNV